MYSHEIEEYLKIRDYLLTAKEYIKILQESPQIDHIICDNGRQDRIDSPSCR